MNKKTLIKEIADLDNTFQKQTGFSFLKDYKGWKKIPLQFLIMITDKLTLLVEQTKK